MTELQIVPNTPTLPDSVTHVPSAPHKPIVVLKALIGGVEQTWYVYGDDDEDVAHKLPRVHRYIQELRKKFGGEELPIPHQLNDCGQPIHEGCIVGILGHHIPRILVRTRHCIVM